MPLNEKGWFIVGRDAYEIALAKRGENQDETFAIQAKPFMLPTFNTHEEFAHLIKESQADDINPQRFNIIKQEVTDYQMKGTDCVKSHLITEDNAAVKISSRPDNMLLEALTLTCALPIEKSIGISFIYSQRYYPGQGDPSFVEKAASVLNSIEFTDPQPPYPSTLQQVDSKSPPVKFSLSCTDRLGKRSTGLPLQIPASHTDAMQKTEADPVHKLAAMGISVGRNGSTKGNGSYALFKKDQNGAYSLTAVKPYYNDLYIEPNDFRNKEVLFVSSGLDIIAPAFASYKFVEVRQAFLCGSGSKRVTGIDSSDRTAYNPCDSSLTSARNTGTSIIANTALTVLSAGLNIVTGSSATFVDTDKEKVAGLVVNSELFECLKEAKLADLNAVKQP